MTGATKRPSRASRSTGRRAVTVACGIVACLLAVSLLSCRKEDFALFVMAGYGVADRLSTSRNKPMDQDDAVAPLRVGPPDASAPAEDIPLDDAPVPLEADGDPPNQPGERRLDSGSSRP